MVIISGFFNPLHGGHLDLIEGAAKLGDRLVVIVNNDIQQVMKKDKIILSEQNRARLMGALRDVDEVIMSVDTKDGSQTRTLEVVANKYPDDELIFCNGGDRSSTQALPEPESAICEQYGIQMVFGVGSHEVEKRDSSTRINQALGHAK